MRHPTTFNFDDVAWRGIRILLFSQDDAFRFLVRQTFRKLNVRDVLSTSVPADASPMMKQVPDIGLIDLDGDVSAALAFLERVRAASGDMPVLMVARSGEKAGIDASLMLGIEGVVPKLVSGHELAHRIADTLKTPKRMPPPQTKPAPRMALPPLSVTLPPVEAPTPTAVATAASVSAESAALKSELAALTARLEHGHTLGKAGASGALVGGTYGEAEKPRPATSSGGWGEDELAAGTPTPAPSSDAVRDAAAPAVKNNRLTTEDLAPSKGGKLEALAAAAPAALKLKAKDQEARRREEEAKARWQAELAQTGHESRTGADVAGLDITAIIAAHLAWLTSKGGDGKRATFQGMDLAGGDLSRAVLANATFREVDLSDALLAESRLDGADFRYAKLGAADLTGANLGVAQLRHADLRLANLQGATLRGADLSGARLRGAKLAGADFGSVMLVGTDLREVDLSEVEGLTQAQVDKAECDMKTNLPSGIFRPRPKDAAAD